MSLIAIAAAGALYLVSSRLIFGRLGGAKAVIGTLCACYTNAGNLGLPIAASIMGDMTWMVPIMLLQVGFMQPLALVALDARNAKRSGTPMPWHAYLTLPVRNPITIAVLAGVGVNLAGITIPDVVMTPIEMVGAVAVPAMLLAFGISLRLDPLPGRGEHAAEVWLIPVIKVVLQPLIAWALGAFLLGLTGPTLLAVVVIAALPAAQNIYVIASRYEANVQMARDSIFWSTMLAVPSITLIATLLGG